MKTFCFHHKKNKHDAECTAGCLQLILWGGVSASETAGRSLTCPSGRRCTRASKGWAAGSIWDSSLEFAKKESGLVVLIQRICYNKGQKARAGSLWNELMNHQRIIWKAY